MKPILTHTGESKMVNISCKEENKRFARASCIVKTTTEVIKEIESSSAKKGDVLRVAEIAGIMAAKKTSDLIPLCHQLNLSTCNIKIELQSASLTVNSYVETISKTGVEMEALVACSVAAMTIYDMCKSADKLMVIDGLRLTEKSGGKSGHIKLV